MTTHEGAIIREGVEADQIRAIEHERLRALVEADMEVTRQIHANDYPANQPLRRIALKGAIPRRSGVRRYRLPCLGTRCPTSTSEWRDGRHSILLAAGNRGRRSEGTSPALLAHGLL